MKAFALPRMASDAPVLFLGGLFMALLILPLTLAMGLDARTLEGVNVWVKPLKFAVALAVYLLTLAYFSRFASPDHNAARSVRIWHMVVIFCVLSEMAWIGGAAMFGLTSHFNTRHDLLEILYPIMGVFAVTLTAASLVLGIAILRRNAQGVSLAIGVSLIAGFAMTCLTAGYMSQMSGHFVGGVATDILPVMGWARDAGDLRVPHFFALHIIHFAPALALVAIGLGLRSRAAMVAPTLLFAALTLATFVQARAGQPFLPFLG